MNSPLISRRNALFRISLPALAALTSIPCSVPAGEKYGKWDPESRALAAGRFMVRMQKEFKERADRLQAFMGKSPKLEFKFTGTYNSTDPKTAAEWKRFCEGGLGENGTSKFIDRIIRELEANRKLLAAAERPASQAWEKKYKDNPPAEVIPPAQQAMIYEMDVQAAKLGVIMDSSMSMTPYLPALQKEISTRFPNAHFAEVESCYLEIPDKHWGLHGEWFYTVPMQHKNLFDAKNWLPEIPKDDLHFHIIQWERDTMAAMTAMAANMEVDAIYWFCDFDDEIERHAIRALDDLLTKNKVRLYVHTVKSNPPPSLGNLIKKTGGSLTKATPPTAPAEASK